MGMKAIVADAVTRAFAELGDAVESFTLRKTTGEGAYSGGTFTPSNTDTAISGVRAEESETLKDGEPIRVLKLTLKPIPAGPEPEAGDHLIVDGTERKILDVSATRLGGDALVFDVQISL